MMSGGSTNGAIIAAQSELSMTASRYGLRWRAGRKKKVQGPYSKPHHLRKKSALSEQENHNMVASITRYPCIDGNCDVAKRTTGLVPLATTLSVRFSRAVQTPRKQTARHNAHAIRQTRARLQIGRLAVGLMALENAIPHSGHMSFDPRKSYPHFTHRPSFLRSPRRC